MRLQGKITRWDDDKGFGFVTWHGDNTSVFVHIKAFRPKSRRPVLGDIVSYEITKDKSGRKRAESVRWADQPTTRKKPDYARSKRMAPVIFTVLFLCALAAAAYFNRIPWLVVNVYLAVSFVTFLAYGWDKSSARMGKWRTKESTLHLFELACGWPGALIAQRVFRHKAIKRSEE